MRFFCPFHPTFSRFAHTPSRSTSTVSPLSSSALFDAVYVINLDRRPDRWAFITRQLYRAGFDRAAYERLSAIDGTQLDLDKAHACGLLSALGVARAKAEAARQVWGMDLTLGAIGCAMSHALVWSRVAARRQRCVLVVEDDSLFPNAFPEACGRRLACVPADWELVYVSGLDPAEETPRLAVAPGVSRVPSLHRTTNCYVLNHVGARRLLEVCVPLTYQIDTLMTARTSQRAVGGVPYVVQPISYTLRPPLVVQATRMGSDIQSDNGRDVREEERTRCRLAGWSEVDIERGEDE